MGASWLKSGTKPALIIAALTAAALIALAAAMAVAALRGQADREASSERVAALAAQVKPGEVTMYVADGCLYCNLATEWLNQRSFTYTECNISSSDACARAFKAYGARGTPFLVVRGAQMREGFQPGVFLKILSQRPA